MIGLRSCRHSLYVVCVPASPFLPVSVVTSVSNVVVLVPVAAEAPVNGVIVVNG